jgi:hypothetical protein
MNYTKNGDQVTAYPLSSTTWRWEVRTATNRLLQTGTANSKETAMLDGVRWAQATEAR